MTTCAAAGALRSTVTGNSLPPADKVNTASRAGSLNVKVSVLGAARSSASAAGSVLRNLACPKSKPIPRDVPITCIIHGAMACKGRMGFAMLIALLLPLQGFGGMAPCNERVSTSISAAAPAVQRSCAHANTAIHQHNCSHACCGVAMGLTAATFIAPRHRPAE